MLNFCTLFNSSFLSRGLAMYESLKKYCAEFHLYIFAFDDKTYKVLSSLNLDKASIISLKDFENPELLAIKKTRTPTEYFWTCTPATIEYVINEYQVPECTYLDADIYFFGDPKILLDEIGNKSVLITEHGYFPKEFDQTATSGRFCVQFITFKNNEAGLNILKNWKELCFKWCYVKMEEGKFGDQKYLDDWPEKYPEDVHILKNIGGGAAPWNTQRFSYFLKNKRTYIKDLTTNKTQQLIFYHFHGLRFYTLVNNFRFFKLNYKRFDYAVSTRYIFSASVKKYVYQEYFKHLNKIKKQVAPIDNSIDPHGSRVTVRKINDVYNKIKNKFKLKTKI
jgi:hypothetical protein